MHLTSWQVIKNLYGAYESFNILSECPLSGRGVDMRGQTGNCFCIDRRKRSGTGQLTLLLNRNRLIHNVHPPCNSFNVPFVCLQEKQMLSFGVSVLIRPSVVVKRLTLLLRILEVPCSYLGPETGYPDYGCSQFSSVPPGKFWDSTLN
jgi:hypothetical protein